MMGAAATGNVVVMGIAAIVSFLISLFSGGSGGGGKGKGKGTGDQGGRQTAGTGKQGTTQGVKGGDPKQPVTNPATPQNAGNTGSGNTVVHGKAGSDYDLVVAGNGDVTVTGAPGKSLEPFMIPAASFDHLRYDLVVGDGKPAESKLQLDWKRTYLQSISYSPEDDTLTLVLGGDGASPDEQPVLKSASDGTLNPLKSVQLTFKRTGEAVGRGEISAVTSLLQ